MAEVTDCSRFKYALPTTIQHLRFLSRNKPLSVFYFYAPNFEKVECGGGGYWATFCVTKVKDQIMYFLVIVSPPKLLDLAASNFVAG